MSPARARQTVLFLMAWSVAASVFSEAVDDDDERFKPRIVLGGLVATFFLLALTNRAARLAAGMATVVAITATVQAGGAIEQIEGIIQRFSGASTPRGDTETPEESGPGRRPRTDVGNKPGKTPRLSTAPVPQPASYGYF